MSVNSDVSSSENDPGAQQRASLKGVRVLVVEDEPIIALDLDRTLQDHGATTVGPAMDVEAALELIDHNRGGIDVAVLDFNLHGRPVLPVADALMERDIPYLFHSGHATGEMVGNRHAHAPICRKCGVWTEILDQVGKLAA